MAADLATFSPSKASMTSTSKLVALVCVCSLIFAFINRDLQLAVLSLSFLLWLMAAYIVFRVRCWRMKRKCSIRRAVQENVSPSGFLWSGRTYTVNIDFKSKGVLPRGALFRDIVPDLFEIVPSATLESSSKRENRRGELYSPEIASTLSTSGNPRGWQVAVKWLNASEPPDLLAAKSQDPPHEHLHRIESSTRRSQFRYHIRPRGAGIAILPGVRIEFTDSLKWFRWDAILPFEQKLTILPSYHKSAELRSLLKSHNAIPQHGIHRQRRPGMGFELLELREYRDGDPPKSIAWKASARRENLMTRQYETEVPVRVNFIVEGALATRIGSFGHRTIDQINSVATSLAHIATQNGDWVGASLLDDSSVTVVPSATGNKGFHQLAHALSNFCSKRYPRHVRWSEDLQNAAFALASEYYPHLLQRSLNPSGYSWFDGLLSRTRREHVQLANLFAVRYRLSELQHAAALTDQHVFSSHLQRFLTEHGTSWLSPMLHPIDLTRSMRPAKWQDLIKALQKSVLHAKDNEVFVLFVDILALDRTLSPLVDACRMARARHHRVVVISTSPFFERPELANKNISASSAKDLRLQSEKLRIADQAQKAKREFREIGVPCSFASTIDSIPWILAEVELARSGRHSRSGTNA